VSPSEESGAGGARWFRVFGGDAGLDPVAVLAALHRLNPTLTAHFHGDAEGWFRAVVSRAGGPPLAVVERYLSSEEGIRAELLSWAAWVEATDDPRHAPLVGRLATAGQLFTLRPAEGADQLCADVCRVLAALTAGLWQADGLGLLGADGTLLVPDREADQ
jgi:hypothetical protein